MKRHVFLTDGEYDTHLLRHSSRRFAQDFTWLSCRYRYRTRKVSSSVAYAAAGLQDQPTIQNIMNVASHARDGINRNRNQIEMEGLMKKLISYGSKMKTTFINIMHERKHLFAHLSSPELTDPTWFITLSSADLYWYTFHKI